jgi:single-strand DNA-binding protein
MNQVVLVGRLAGDVNYKEYNNNKKAIITLAVPRPFKNAEGVYETDFIDCTLLEGVAQNTKEYCKKGDIIGVKGRIQTNNYETEDDEKRKSTQIIAEKVTFLSSNKKEEKEGE